MPGKPIHLPQHVLESLHDSAARLGGVPVEVLVRAAVRTFNRYEAEYRSWVVREFWFRGELAIRPQQPTWGGRLYELVRAVVARVGRRVVYRGGH